MANPAIAVAMTGASGTAYGMRLLQILLATGNKVYLMISEPGRLVINTELGFKLSSRTAEIKSTLDERFEADPDLLHVYGREDWFSPPASGSNPPRAMAVCPCTSGTLASIAQGMSRNLIERAADVVLKEKKRLVLVPRETPFSILHLENMLRLARMGAVILPANPGFYQKPTTIEELVDFIVARVLDHLGVEYDLLPRWGSSRG